MFLTLHLFMVRDRRQIRFMLKTLELSFVAFRRSQTFEALLAPSSRPEGTHFKFRDTRNEQGCC